MLEPCRRSWRPARRSWLGLRARQAAIGDTIEALRRELAAIGPATWATPQRHLRHPHRPVPPEETRYNVIVEVWSAISVGVLLLLVAGLVFFHLVPWWGALIVGVVGYVLIESALRRRLTTVLLRVVLVLAVVTAVILVFDFRLELVLAAVAGAGAPRRGRQRARGVAAARSAAAAAAGTSTLRGAARARTPGARARLPSPT